MTKANFQSTTTFDEAQILLRGDLDASVANNETIKCDGTGTGVHEYSGKRHIYNQGCFTAVRKFFKDYFFGDLQNIFFRTIEFKDLYKGPLFKIPAIELPKYLAGSAHNAVACEIDGVIVPWVFNVCYHKERGGEKDSWELHKILGDMNEHALDTSKRTNHCGAHDGRINPSSLLFGTIVSNYAKMKSLRKR
ncbi:MAG: hypothetical protein LBG89_03795 [Rickettsiales bacterium]|jgi:hypothetical protein|nr:hypothetical protein [Rickettsiales bacterium]